MLNINANNRIPSSSHDRILILTDLEPDDALALKILKKVIPTGLPIMVIVGEGTPDKTNLAAKILDEYKYQNYQVLQGRKSEKDFPSKALEAYGISDVKTVDASQGLIERFLELGSPLIIGIKPLWELLDINKELLAKCVMLLYGSFNLRCMLSKIGREEIASFLNNSFKHVIMYESFPATGNNNSINRANAHAIFQNLETVNPDEGLVNLIEAWSSHMIKEHLESIATLAKKMVKDPDWQSLRKDYDRLVNRNLKVVTSVIEAEGVQMVLADFALIAYVFNDIRSDVVRGDMSMNMMAYTVMKPSETGKIYMPTGLDFVALLKCVEEMMN